MRSITLSVMGLTASVAMAATPHQVAPDGRGMDRPHGHGLGHAGAFGPEIAENEGQGADDTAGPPRIGVQLLGRVGQGPHWNPDRIDDHDGGAGAGHGDRMAEGPGVLGGGGSGGSGEDSVGSRADGDPIDTHAPGGGSGGGSGGGGGGGFGSGLAGGGPGSPSPSLQPFAALQDTSSNLTGSANPPGVPGPPGSGPQGFSDPPQSSESAAPPSVSAVPEPASWLMMVLGVGLVGATLRSGRRIAGSNRRPNPARPN